MAKKYAKIIDEKTRECEVGIGTNIAYYKSLGMKEFDVEKSYNGRWYLVGYVPEEPEEEKKVKRKKEIIKQLDALDLKAIRSLRALQSGIGTDVDRQVLENIESQAEELRAKLKELGA